MKEQLKPCPFCGKNNLKITQDNAIEPIFFFVICILCECEGPSRDTKKDAATKWNNRPFEKDMPTQEECSTPTTVHVVPGAEQPDDPHCFLPF